MGEVQVHRGGAATASAKIIMLGSKSMFGWRVGSGETVRTSRGWLAGLAGKSGICAWIIHRSQTRES